MAELHDTDYLSIGEVLGLLLEEFPDITISKIRFLESQGLIDPERTPSGYRKFYEPDVELLRVILREQRENYLPLRVIKDRIDSGVIDPSGEFAKPHPVEANGHHDRHGNDGNDDSPAIDVPASSVAAHPAATRTSTEPAGDEQRPPAPTGAGPENDGHRAPATPQLLPGVVLDRNELCAMTGASATELTQLEEFGIITGRGSGGTTLYGDDAVQIARTAVEFMRAGVDARHLRGWRTAAEREASLYEQLITPKLRQRNPESRAEALAELRRLEALGAELRSAMVRMALRHHFES
jgi:DNA-binding transcriptional MerR regulator